MKQITTKLFIFIFLLFTVIVCSDDIKDDNGNEIIIEDEISNSMSPVSNLKADATLLENEISLSWKNPVDKDLFKIEIIYEATGTKTRSSANPTLVDAVKGENVTYLITVPHYDAYKISLTAINRAGARSIKKTVEATPLKPAEEKITMPVFLGRADTIMTAMVNLYLGGPRDVWNSSYPKANGPYWDGDALVWGQGAGFSAFTAIREATVGTQLESKYAGMDNRMFTSINKFFVYDNGMWAYAVYPQSGNDRYYDDNVWVGLDMIDLYLLSYKTAPQYLEKAKNVWEYLKKGTDNIAGGGIHWRELPPTSSKHTCSTAPGVVLAAKLYNATGEEKYLNNALELYSWLKNTLQDPTDHLYWDNAKEENGKIVIEKNKYSYNSGQPMQAAVLLYNITGNISYLNDAQEIAESAYRRWFSPFYSAPLKESIRMISGHTWFNAIMFRGFIELYKAEMKLNGEADRTYITAYEKSLSHAWLSNCRQPNNLLNEDYSGRSSQNSWDILHQGASTEMLARLASLERDGL